MDFNKRKWISLFAGLIFGIVFNVFGSTSNVNDYNQLNFSNSGNDSVFTFVEKMPAFPGGENALFGFLNKTIQYPAEARKKNEQGKVIVQFVVNSSGKVEKAKILKGVSPSLDAEALRVINLLPDWTPGEQNGEKVSVYRILPMMFKNLTEEEAWKPSEKTLVVLDSIKMPTGFNTNILNPEKLASVEILKPFPKETKEILTKKYGHEAVEGVIVINTKKDEMEYALADSVTIPPEDCKEKDVIPQFPGGKNGLSTYLNDSIHYPFIAKETKKQGKVFVQFLVNKTGKVTDAKVVRPIDYFLDKEALRVITAMPDWMPGAKCGQKANIWVTMPIEFKLDLPAAEKGWERNEKTIILLDGKRLPPMFNLDWLNYANLSSYQILQPSSKEITKKLVSKYGKDAANGVILIESRK